MSLPTGHGTRGNAPRAEPRSSRALVKYKDLPVCRKVWLLSWNLVAKSLFVCLLFRNNRYHDYDFLDFFEICYFCFFVLGNKLQLIFFFGFFKYIFFCVLAF